MPTLVLLDKSLSMKRPISERDTSVTRLSLAKSGIDMLFTYFQTVFPSEYVALMSFSSSCSLVVPFTKDYSELREGLESITAEDKTDVYNAFRFLTEIVTKEWGMFVPIQVILITDGLLNISQTTNQQQQQVCFPFPCQFNVLLIAHKDEMTTPTLINQTETLSNLINIPTNQILSLSKTSKLSLESTREAFLQLTKDVFYPYSGVLKCGHLECNFTLSPSPRMVRTCTPISTDSQHKFINPYNVSDFPTVIKVCGFLDVSTVSAPAVYSKHFLIDSEFGQKDKLEKLLKNLLIQDGETFRLSDESSESDNNSGKPSFRVLLHGSLKCEAKLAVVQLSDNWYGLLSSASVLSKKSNLILTVLFPGVTVPWFGKMSYLGPKISGKDPRLSDNTPSYPVTVPHVMSYQAPSTLYWAKENGVQTDFTKMIRYSHKLPEKEASLIKELNKLRQVVLTYSLPHLIDVICKILVNQERSSSTSPQAKAILQRCVQFLTNNHNPHDKLTSK